MRAFIIWPILLAPLLFCGCTESDNDDLASANIEPVPANSLRILPDKMPDAASINILQSHIDYSFSEFQTHTPAEENSLIAPFDWQQFMSMLALGAEGVTLDTFSDAVNLDFNSYSVYEDVSVWEQEITAIAAIERWSYLWGQNNYLFSIDYLRQQAELVGPLMKAYDFQTDAYQSLLDINEVLSSSYYLIDIRTRLVAAQITNINSGWSSSLLAESITARFGGALDQQWVDMMKFDGLLNAYQGSNYKAVQVPFNDSALSLMVITPDEGSFTSVRNNLNSASWNHLIENLSPNESTVFVPKFILDRELTAEELPLLGIALSDTDASFSVVNNAGFLYLRQPKQKISLSINENGVKSATKNLAVFAAMDNEPESLFLEPEIGFEDLNNGYINYSAYTVTVESYEVSYKPCFYPPDQSPFIFVIYDATSKTLFNLGQIKTLEGQIVTADWQVPDTTECGTEPPVEIYKSKASLQCGISTDISYPVMQLELTNAGIEVLEASEGYDGLVYPQVCGAPDGIINIFSIRESKLSEAQALGFTLLSELP